MALTATELSSLLPRDSVFSDCSSEELEAIIGSATEILAKPGQIVLEDSEIGEAILLILEGVIRESGVLANGEEFVLNYVEPGSLVGEIAMLDGFRPVHATTLGQGRFLKIRRSAFDQLVETHPRIAFRVMRNLAQRLKFFELGSLQTRALGTGPRLAAFLSERIPDGATSPIDISYSEIRNITEFPRDNVMRQLSIWESEGVVELPGGLIRIVDIDYIQGLAETLD